MGICVEADITNAHRHGCSNSHHLVDPLRQRPFIWTQLSSIFLLQLVHSISRLRLAGRMHQKILWWWCMKYAPCCRVDCTLRMQRAPGSVADGAQKGAGTQKLNAVKLRLALSPFLLLFLLLQAARLL